MFKNQLTRNIFLTLSLIFVISIIVYLLLFPYIIPSYRQASTINIDTESWNLDNDIHSIENYFIEFTNYNSHVKVYENKNGILYRLPYEDKKKYILKPGVDTLYIATDMSRKIISDYTKFVESDDSSYLERILSYSFWLKDNARIYNGVAIWPYPFIFTKYDLDYDWCGAWALGNILSAISRTIVLTNDPDFITLADQVVKTFETKIENGGIVYFDKNKNYWFEEYPAIPPSHVLNGHINGLLGLYDYWRISHSENARILFEKGIETVKANINKFDSGYWSFYDLQYPYVSDYYYHKAVHIPQLKILFQITKDQVFKNYFTKWQKYFEEPYLSFFKIKMLYDGLHRRFTYKSFFTLGK